MSQRLPSTITTTGTQVSRVVRTFAHRLERFSDRALDALQANLVELFRPAAVLPIGDGNLIKGVVFPNGTPVVITHYLERAYVGTIVLTPSAPARFSKVTQAVSLDASQATLQADAACTADVYVF